jgi:hypothetical protein
MASRTAWRASSVSTSTASGGNSATASAARRSAPLLPGLASPCTAVAPRRNDQNGTGDDGAPLSDRWYAGWNPFDVSPRRPLRSSRSSKRSSRSSSGMWAAVAPASIASSAASSIAGL